MCIKKIKLPNTKWVRYVTCMGGWHEYTKLWMANNNKVGLLFMGSEEN